MFVLGLPPTRPTSGSNGSPSPTRSEGPKKGSVRDNRCKSEDGGDEGLSTEEPLRDRLALFRLLRD